jgi:hypothetical protein
MRIFENPQKAKGVGVAARKPPALYFAAQIEFFEKLNNAFEVELPL